MLRQADYDPQEIEFIVGGFRYGFDLCYRGPQFRQSKSQNLPFNVGNPTILWQKLMKEVWLLRVAGPFDQIPYDNFIQSPIGLVPKDKGTQTRLIFHLSYDFPDGSKSVNFHTTAELCSVHYNDLDTAVNLCLKLCESGASQVYMSKTDGQSAFRFLPLLRSCWKWLIMKAVDPRDEKKRFKYFVDKCLPFGSSISCSHFQRVSDALRHLACYRSGRSGFLSNYLDDFLFLARLLAECNQLMQQFLDLCLEVGFPISADKTVWATLQIVFLGILLNGQSFTLSIPLEKHTVAQDMLQKILQKNKVTVRELQQLCAYLNFLTRAIFPGKVFTRCMYSKFGGIMYKKAWTVRKIKKEPNSPVSISKKLKPYHHICLDHEFKFDAEVWLQFLSMDLSTVVNRPMIDLAKQPVPPADLNFYSDASANPELGFGCIYNNCCWIGEQWKPNFINSVKPSIEYLELYALCAGVFTWEYELRNLRMLVHCDNEAVVSMINNQSSSCVRCTYLLRILTLKCLQFSRRIFAQHVLGKRNVAADTISRRQWRHFHQVVPNTMKPIPDRVSRKVWPLSRLWNAL